MKRNLETPNRRCREPFTGTVRAYDQEVTMDYFCELDEYHRGPCASKASQESMERRAAWEKQHPTLKDQKNSRDIMIR